MVKHMSWLWWLQLAQHNPSAFGQIAFVWLLGAAAIGVAWYASRRSPRSAAAELAQLHRQVDELRARIRDASRAGESVEHLRQQLERLCNRLPSGDVRRY